MSETLDKSINRLWDGLRALPCSEEDIAVAVANCIALNVRGRESRVPTMTDGWQLRRSVTAHRLK